MSNYDLDALQVIDVLGTTTDYLAGVDFDDADDPIIVAHSISASAYDMNSREMFEEFLTCRNFGKRRHF